MSYGNTEKVKDLYVQYVQSELNMINKELIFENHFEVKSKEGGYYVEIKDENELPQERLETIKSAVDWVGAPETSLTQIQAKLENNDRLLHHREK